MNRYCLLRIRSAWPEPQPQDLASRNWLRLPWAPHPVLIAPAPSAWRPHLGAEPRASLLGSCGAQGQTAASHQSPAGETACSTRGPPANAGRQWSRHEGRGASNAIPRPACSAACLGEALSESTLLVSLIGAWTWVSGHSSLLASLVGAWTRVRVKASRSRADLFDYRAT